MSYIYIIKACFEKLVPYLDTKTHYSENIASYCDTIMITINIIYNDVDVRVSH